MKIINIKLLSQPLEKTQTLLFRRTPTNSVFPRSLFNMMEGQMVMPQSNQQETKARQIFIVLMLI
jgi:hypothetical protein